MYYIGKHTWKYARSSISMLYKWTFTAMNHNWIAAKFHQ